jgi:hypothetical protein
LVIGVREWYHGASLEIMYMVVARSCSNNVKAGGFTAMKSLRNTMIKLAKLLHLAHFAQLLKYSNHSSLITVAVPYK